MSNKMRVLFVGSKNMGYYALNILYDFQKQGYLDLVGVVSRDDDDKSHWYKSVSKLARELNLKLYMPKKLTGKDFLKEIKSLKPDIGLCCFYPKLFKESFFSIPKNGFLNLHFAPLPRYRGALPIPYAIINEEKEHGVTIHKIDNGMDSGPIIAQKLFPVFNNDTGYQLYTRCEKYGQILFHETVQKIIACNGKIAYRNQVREEVISYTRSDHKSLEIDTKRTNRYIYNYVRAFDFPPFPLPYIFINNKKYFLSTIPEKHGFSKNKIKEKKFGDYSLYLINADDE